MSSPILVTGATGYIAGHVIEQLLAAGHTVRGSVRDPGADAKLAHLRALPGAERLSFVEAHLDRDAGWAEAVAGCAQVLHMASPLPIGEPDDPMDLIRPARDGATRVLRACADAGVRRMVFTSSSAAIVTEKPDGYVYSETDWPGLEEGGAYKRSKTHAERALWELLDALPEDGRPELVCLNPVLVVGPVQQARANTSIEPVRRILAGALPAIPRLSWNLVDVRDVAAAHVVALDAPGVAGKRYALTAGHRWMRDLATDLAQHYRGRRSIVTRPAPWILLWAMSWVDQAAARVLPDVGRERPIRTDAARADLGFDPRDPLESVRDCADSMLAHGIVD